MPPRTVIVSFAPQSGPEGVLLLSRIQVCEHDTYSFL